MSLPPSPDHWGSGEEIPLLGGDVTEGVVRVGETVRRPVGPNGPVIHALLRHLERVGFDGAPRFLGLDQAGREVLTFLPGEVAGRPRPDWIADQERLTSVARLLRRFDDAALGFELPAGLVPDWGVPDSSELPELPDLPAEPGPILIGHQDVTPENVIFRDARAVALIDFDLVKPVTRSAEVLNALIWWAPLGAEQDRDPPLAGVDVPQRCRLFVDAYGLDRESRRALLPSGLVRTRRSWALMKYRADHHGGGWARMWDEGIGDVINRRHDWLVRQSATITAALLD